METWHYEISHVILRCVYLNLSKDLPYSNVKKSYKPVVSCHTSKQWVIQNSIHKDGNYGLKNCTQHKKVRIMIDLFTLKPLHLWPVSPGGWLRNRKHASSILFSFETRRRRTKLLCLYRQTNCTSVNSKLDMTKMIIANSALRASLAIYSWLPITRILANSNLALTRTKINFPWISLTHLLGNSSPW